MIHSRLVFTFVALVFGLLGPGASSIRGQDFDLEDILSHDSFYEEQGILDIEGDVKFLGDVWVLPAGPDSARALLGLSLSNSDLQFERMEEGGWQADYEVLVALEAKSGGPAPPEQRWAKSVQVATFDETLLSGETIVFQTELGLAPGSYDAAITVRDRNADEASRGLTRIEVPAFEGAAIGEPVPLKLYQRQGSVDEFVVNPGHTYEVAPSVFEFLAQASGLDAATEYALRARLVAKEEGESPAGEWSGTVTASSDGLVRHFGRIDNQGARFGEYDLEVRLENATGQQLATASTPLLVAGSGGWIAKNWDKALSLIKYEATDKELDILEDIEGERQRIEAWNCFWSIRDPVPATATNEGLVDYFRKIQIANVNWKSALRPGYLSDRGRVYITLGPPDDIAQRPVPAGSDAFEVWTYYRYNFQILFVDRIGFNNYQIENVDTYQRELSVIERRKRRFLQERSGECPLLAPAFQ